MNEDKSLSPARVFMILAISIFGIELLIMVAFLIAPPLPPVLETVVDSTALILLASPIIYRFAIQPLYNYIGRIQQLSHQHAELNRILEEQVEDRTDELKKRSLELAKQTQEFEKANMQLQRRTSQFGALAEVTQAITSVRDLQQLLPFI